MQSAALFTIAVRPSNAVIVWKRLSAYIVKLFLPSGRDITLVSPHYTYSYEILTGREHVSGLGKIRKFRPT